MMEAVRKKQHRYNSCEPSRCDTCILPGKTFLFCCHVFVLILKTVLLLFKLISINQIKVTHCGNQFET